MSKKHYQFIKNSLLVLCISLAFSCANIVAPTGGPKDITPPKVKISEPPNYSANVSGNKIQITFNEYVVLEDQANQIVVSPPTEEPPEFNIKGKSIVIDLPKDIRDSITYTIYFGESIRDNNEGNILSGYEYAFSKSNVVDSFSMQGQVYDALTLEPQKGILVMLYTSDDDSMPIKNKPCYLTKTDAGGKFFLKNLKRKKYKIFVLKDMNADMMFNQPTELIAFADSMLTPQYVPVKVDSVAVEDSLSVTRDSIIIPEIIRSTSLYLFIQPDTNQKLLKDRADTYRQFKLFFKYPVKDLKISVTNKQMPENWNTIEYSRGRDSLTCWLSSPDLDTLKCILSDKGIIIDTLEIALKQKPDESKNVKKPSGKGSDDLYDLHKLGISCNANASNRFPYFAPLKLRLSHPGAKTDYSKIILSEKIDSNFVEIKPRTYFPDSNITRTLNLEYKWEAEKTYRLLVLPGAFTDVYGLVNDSLSVSFSTNKPEDYGRLLFTIKPEESNKSFIVQLLKEDKSFLEQRPGVKGQPIIFDNLGPGNYHIRIVIDENNNGKWDAGDYFQKRQPERVFYFPDLINIRANWDTEYDFLF
ncbi:MAG TPA: Ig-like domain-containing protein [Bacteroidales bacterium]|nr:Ig-like domain-containing protein [Bacteroidales bacterium]